MSILLNEMMKDSPSDLWPLTETSGTAFANIVTPSRAGTAGGTTITAGGRATLLGPAPDFSGGYISMGDVSAWSTHAGISGTFTITCWVVPDNVAISNQMVVSKGTGGTYEFDFRIGYVSSGTLYAGVHQASGSAAVMETNTPGGTVANGSLYHLAMVYNRATPIIAVYLNGTQVAQSSTTNGTSSDGSAAFRVGVRADSAGGSFDGAVSHVAYYPTSLSAARIKAHYQTGITMGVVRGG